VVLDKFSLAEVTCKVYSRSPICILSERQRNTGRKSQIFHVYFLPLLMVIKLEFQQQLWFEKTRHCTSIQYWLVWHTVRHIIHHSICHMIKTG